MTNRLRCVISVRVSTEEQASGGHSLEAQEKVCRALCAARGWDVVAVFSDPGASGKTDRRPGFQKMIAAVRAGQADIVMTHKLDRFSRSISDILKYMLEFNRLGVAYVSATEQFDFTTPTGKVMLVMLAAFAEWFLDNLSQETTKGKRQRAEKGYSNGDLPIGYRLAADGLHAEPDPETAPCVRLAFHEYALDRYSDTEIAKILNQAGYKTQYKGGARPFSKDSVRALLKNPFYSGRVSYKGELFPGQHKPLVDIALFERCQVIRRRRARISPIRRSANPKQVYLLSRLAYCGECRRALRGQSDKASHRYYRDPDHDHGGDCRQKRVLKATRLEDDAGKILTAIILPDGWKRQIVDAAPASPDAGSLERRQARVRLKLSRSKELYTEGHYTRPEYERAIAEAETELAALKPVPVSNVRSMAELLDDLPHLWELATPPEKKKLAQAMLERVYILNGQVAAIQPNPDFYSLMQQTGLFVGGGPDEIRTRDLGLDRAACLAATPRVRSKRGGTIP
jgi:site-specific DNA recombinase